MAIRDTDVEISSCNKTMPKIDPKLLKDLETAGFSHDYSLRALAATGYNSFRVTTEWIATHINDPLMKSDYELDFLIFLGFGKEIESDILAFLSESRTLLGWNAVCETVPCIPIMHVIGKYTCAFQIRQIFEKTFDSLEYRENIGNSNLEFLVSNDLTCFFCSLNNPMLAKHVRDLSEQFLQNISNAGLNVRVISHNSNYQFCLIKHNLSKENVQILTELHKTYLINPNRSKNNQLNFLLYSHDPRLRIITNPEVYEIMTDIELNSSDKPYIVNYNTELQSVHVSCDLTESEWPNSPEFTCSVSNEFIPLIMDNQNDQTENIDRKQINQTIRNQIKSISLNMLSHFIGDYIMLIGSGSLPGCLGYPIGINLSTGAIGIFNILASRRVPQYYTWKLFSCKHFPIRSVNQTNMANGNQLSDNKYLSKYHKLITQNSGIISSSVSSCPSLNSSNFIDKNSNKINSSHSNSIIQMNKKFHTIHNCSPNNNCDQITSKSSLSSLNCPSSLSISCELNPPIHHPHFQLHHHHCFIKSPVVELRRNSTKNRQLYIMRHAERVDMCFGRAWVTHCFDQKGIYHRLNLNLPPWLPPRSSYFDYVLDSPITQVGLFVSAETGRALAEAGVMFTACYSSPAFRCIQTASELLRAMGQSDLLIRIEPHLFEWFRWYENGMPKMMNVVDLKNAGYNVDVNYKSFTSLNDIDLNESITNYYERTSLLISRLLGIHKAKNSCILILAHASSLDTCTRPLVHHGLRNHISSEEFHHRTSNTPYCGLVLAQENKRWTLIDPPIPNVCSYSRNPDFDWKQLLRPTTLCSNFKL